MIKLIILFPLVVVAAYRCAGIAERLFDEIVETVRVI